MDFRDMFQWNKFITPLVVPTFFWVATFAATVIGFFGFTIGVVLLSDYPLIAIITVVFSVTITCLGVLSARMIAELALISFRANDHIYAIRILTQTGTQARTNRDQSPTQIPHAA